LCNCFHEKYFAQVEIIFLRTKFGEISPKKERKTLDSDGANERPTLSQNNNCVVKRERERERERDCVFSSIAVFD
jgi:hypothetical protein